MLYKSCLVGVYPRYTTRWCSEVYVDVPLRPTGLGLYPHKPPPQYVIYLAYTPPNHIYLQSLEAVFAFSDLSCTDPTLQCVSSYCTEQNPKLH